MCKFRGDLDISRMKFPVAAVAELLIAALYSSEHTFHVTYFSYGLMLMFCAHNLHPLNHSMATGQKGEKFELEDVSVHVCTYNIQGHKENGSTSRLFSVLKLATNPHNSLRNIYEKT